MQISGVFAPMITPTTDESEIDTETLREFTTFLVRGGVHGLFAVGTTGEFSSLDPTQRKNVIRTVATHADSVPVLGGCGGTCVQSVREHIDDTAEAGADAAVVVTPYYLDTNQTGLRRFFTEVAAGSPLPIYLYNIPKLTGNKLAPETVAELAENPAIVGIKDSSGDFNYFMDLIEKTPPSFDVLQGIPTYSILSLEMGADGIVTGPANVFPRAVSDLYDALEEGNDERAKNRLVDVLLPILQSTQSIPMVPALRYLSKKAGRDLGDPIPPLPDLTPDQRRKLDECFGDVPDAEPTSVEL